MPRLRYIEESEKTPTIQALIDSAKKTGAPDPRVVSIMTRSEVGTAWVECWNKVRISSSRSFDDHCGSIIATRLSHKGLDTSRDRSVSADDARVVMPGILPRRP